MDFDSVAVVILCGEPADCELNLMKKILYTNVGAAVANMLLAYVVWMVSRLVFFFEIGRAHV